MSHSFTNYPATGADTGLVQDLTPAAAAGTAADAIMGSLKRLYGKTQVAIPQTQVIGLASSIRADGGYSVLSANGNNLGAAATTLTPGAYLTTRWRFLSPANAYSLCVLYGNFRTTGTGGQPGNNAIMVKAAIEQVVAGGVNTQTNPREPVLFSAQRWGSIDPNGLLLSDQNPLPVSTGGYYYVRTCVSPGANGFPPAAAPTSAPTVTTSTSGGSLPSSTTYYVVISYIGPYGETLPSAATPVTTGAGSANILTVTAPGAIAGSNGYKVYIGTASNGPYYLCVPNGVLPLTANATATLAPYAGYPSALTTFVVPGGGSLQGSTIYTGTNTGEGYSSGDLVDDTFGSVQAAPATTYTPLAILGIVPGRILPSAALIGDSIQTGTGDAGYGPNSGGFAWRACQAAGVGFIWVPQGGEQAHQFAQLMNSRIRLAATRWCTNAICNYGTNDLSLGLAQMQVDILIIACFFTNRGQKFFQTTLTPKTTSTDGWQTVVNQTISNGNPATASTGEYARQNFNTWVRSSATTGSAVANETCPFGSANASNKVFSPSQAFAVGTESITVNGTVQTPTTGYTYTQPVTVGSVTYANGVTFVTAPATGATVVMSYTAMPGFVSACGGSQVAGYFDTAATVECNTAGSLTLNGGYWLPDMSGGVLSGTSSGSNTNTSLNDTTKSWTANQYKGMACYISSGTGAGQVRTVSYNTVTQLDFNDPWTTTPDATSHYLIYNGVTQDGTHPCSSRHIMMAAAITTSQLV